MKAVVVVRARAAFVDPATQGTLTLCRELGAAVDAVDVAALYALEGDVSKADLQKVAKDLLADPVTQDVEVFLEGGKDVQGEKGAVTVDVWLKAAVTDPVAPSVERGALDLGVTLTARVGQRYVFKGPLDVEAATRLTWRALANPMMHRLETHAG